MLGDAMELKDLLGEIARKNRGPAKQKQVGQARATPPATPHRLILYVYDSTCRNCGRIEQWSNYHLLACYKPDAVTVNYHAMKYIGPLLEGIPLVLVHSHGGEAHLHDYCRHCFPATEVVKSDVFP